METMVYPEPFTDGMSRCSVSQEIWFGGKSNFSSILEKHENGDLDAPTPVR